MKSSSKTAEQARRDEQRKPLFDFLDSYDARLLSRFTAEEPSAQKDEVRTYLVGPVIIVVTLGEHGWDVFLPASSENSTAETIGAASRLLGPRPGENAPGGPNAA